MADRAHEWTDDQIEALQRKFNRVYAQAASEMREKLEAALSDYAKENSEWKASVAAGHADAKDYDQWLEAQSTKLTYVHDLVRTLANDAANANQIAADMVNDAIPEVYAENANWAAYEIERQIGFDTHSFDLYDRDTVRHILGMDDDDQIMHEVVLKDAKPPMQTLRVHPKRVKDVLWNRQKFNSAIVQSILQGESVPNAAKRLTMVLNMDKNMALRAARTAMTSAENAGRVDSFRRAKAIGIEIEQQWLATFDNRTRMTHRLLHGQHVPVGESFVPDGYGPRYSIRFPGDPAALGEMTWNCRCSLRAWTEGFEQEEQPLWTDWDDGTTYDEWRSGKERSR